MLPFSVGSVRRAACHAVIGGALASCSLQGFDELDSELGLGGNAGAGGSRGGTGGSSGGSGGTTGGNGGSGADAGSAGSSGGGSGGSGGTGGSSGGAGGDAGSGGQGGSGGQEIPVGNIFPDPSFEEGLAGWVPFGTGTQVVLATDVAHTGSQCILTSNRDDTWMGPSHPIDALVIPGVAYTVKAWVRSAKAGFYSATISLKTECIGSVATYGAIGPIGDITADEWIELTGTFVAPTCDLLELLLYIEGPPAAVGVDEDVDYYVDDVSLEAVQ